MLVPTDDAHKDFDRYDREQAAYRARFPQCFDCREHITQGWGYKVEGRLYCPDCMTMVNVEEYDYED